MDQLLNKRGMTNETCRQSDTLKARVKHSLSQLMSRNIYCPVLLLMGLMTLQQLSGGYAVIFYSIHIFKKFNLGTDKGSINEYNALLILGIIRFISSAIASVLSRVIRRKTLLYLSSIWVAIACITISVYQYCLRSHEESLTVELDNILGINGSSVIIDRQNETSTLLTSSINSFHTWLPVICVLIIVSMGVIGILNIPWTLIGEVLPTSIRGSGLGCIISFAYLILFVIIKIYPFLLDLIDIGQLFLVHGIICLIIVIYVYLLVPETFGKSLHEIESYFAK